MKNKRAMILYYPTIIGAVIAVCVYLLYSINSMPIGPSTYIGELQLNVLDAAQQGNNIMLYISQSGKYAAKEAAYDLAKNGGTYEPICGTYLGYPLWSMKGKEIDECFPEYKEGLGLLMNGHMNDFLSLYPGQNIPHDNYDISLGQSVRLNINGVAKKSLNVPIQMQDKKSKGSQITVGNYSIIPSFNISINYDIGIYEILKGMSKELMDKCKYSNDLIKCVEDNKLAVFNVDNLELVDCGLSEEQKKFSEFLDYFMSCASSQQNECYCDKGLNDGLYTISNIIDEQDTVQLKGEVNGIEFAQKIPDTRLFIDSDDFIGKTDYLHRESNGKILIIASKEAKDAPYIWSKSCNNPKKTIFPFCIKDKETQFYIYDETDKEIKLREIIYKFALDISGGVAGSYVWPVDSDMISSCFGKRIINGKEDTHEGIDIPIPIGSPVKSISSGFIKEINEDIGSSAGRYITVKNGEDQIQYLHLSEILVKEGDPVLQGNIIAKSGGSAYGKMDYHHPHLDLRITRNGNWIDPLDPNNGIFVYNIYKVQTASNCYYKNDQYAYINPNEKMNCDAGLCSYALV